MPTEPDAVPRVTPSLLRRADDMCRRKLARELEGAKRHANRTADARFAVSNRLLADARLAHAELGPPRPEAFVDPAELEPEQCHLYRAAARGYLAVFGSRSGRAADIGWCTPLPEQGVELVAPVGLPIELPDGERELRVLRVGGRRPGTPVLDDVDLRVALVRTEGWAPDRLRIVAVDLIANEHDIHTPDLAFARAEARTWIADRVGLVLRRAGDGRPKAGADCNWCPFVAGCEAHR